MAHYLFRCSTCGEEYDHEAPMGTAPRVLKCDCGRPARLLIGQGVYLSAEATPTSKGNVLALARRDSRFDKDAPAYKRMRHRGLQPDHIDGCAQLEDRVGSQEEIDYARAIRVAEKVGGGKERVMDTVASLEATHGDV